MEPKVIIANILSALSYVILILCTVLNTKRKTILFCFLASCALYGANSLILGGYSGAFSQLFSCVMYVVYSKKGKNKFLSSIYIPIGFAVCYIIICIFTWTGLIDLIPLAASLIACYSMWNGKEFTMKVLNIPISVCWISYSIIIMSYAGAIGQGIVLIMDFVYIILFFTKYRFIK